MSEGIASHSTARHHQPGLFQPQVVLPVQHWTFGTAWLPEARLMAAVLEDAINCVQKYRFVERGRQRRLFCEAEHWFMSRDTLWPFAFERICDALGLDADCVRRSLQLSG